MVGPDGTRMEEDKIQDICNWAAPRNVARIRQFLGFANFYRCFIRDFAAVAELLHLLLRKEVVWRWGEPQVKAFEELKKRITSAPVLVHTDPSLKYTLETDVSRYAYGAVLSQKKEDNRLHPVGFLSKAMNPAERNYNIYDKEMLAVVKALQHWRRYLDSTKELIDILTDHKNLEYWTKPLRLNSRQMRWFHILQNYNFKIKY
jgi:hypothetical protein